MAQIAARHTSIRGASEASVPGSSKPAATSAETPGIDTRRRMQINNSPRIHPVVPMGGWSLPARFATDVFQQPER